jgi:hypothetical protein
MSRLARITAFVVSVCALSVDSLSRRWSALAHRVTPSIRVSVTPQAKARGLIVDAAGKLFPSPSEGMSARALVVAVFAGLAWLAFPAKSAAQITPLIACPFGGPFPITCTYALSGGAGSSNMNERAVGQGPPEQAGICGDGTGWQKETVPSGGYQNGPFLRQTLCAFRTVRCVGCRDNSWETGFAYAAPVAHVWPRTTTGIFLRVRVYFEAPWSDNDQIKHFIWNRGSGGSHRVMMLIYRGNDVGCGGTPSQIAVLLTRNNFTDAGVCLLVNPGEWTNLQFQWVHGPVGAAVIRGWKASSVFSAPDKQDTTVYAAEGGPSAWLSSDATSTAGNDWGNRANEGTNNTAAFPVRWANLIIDDEFDPTWAHSIVVDKDGTRVARPNVK